MASGKKSSDRFEAALKRELTSTSPSNAADCLAPEILAAYYDRSLSRGERARVDSHLTSCVRCQSMMASIARADDAERSPMKPEPARGLFWITRLLAPIAVVGVVIAIAIGVRTRQRRAPEVIALASPAGSSGLELEERAAAPPPEIASQAQSAPQAPSTPRAEVAESQKAERSARKEATHEKSESPSVANSTSLQAQSAPGQVAREMRAPSVAAGSALSGAANMVAKAPQTNQISSPDGSVAWQFGIGGAIMRSGNSSVWLALRSGVTSDLLAASAPSNDVCWMAGKSGTIVRTLDSGAHWRLIKAPSRDDFTAISATDSNNATVIAANGQRFTTRDGGVTWSSP